MMRFFLSTATFLADAFFETSPMAIVACTQPGSIQEQEEEEEAALISKDPSLSATGPPHTRLGAGEREMLPACIRAEDTARMRRNMQCVVLFLLLVLYTEDSITSVLSLSPPLFLFLRLFF